MPTVADLPTLNASLNALAAALLVVGYGMIRRRRVTAHRALMLAACASSLGFLVSYVIYHANAGSRPFDRQGWVRPVYFTVLVSHVVLAAIMVPPVAVTLIRALRGRFPDHARVARRTLPIWLYVSVSGIVIYLMLYWR